MDTRGAHTALTCDDVLWRTNVDGSEGSSKLAMPGSIPVTRSTDTRRERTGESAQVAAALRAHPRAAEVHVRRAARKRHSAQVCPVLVCGVRCWRGPGTVDDARGAGQNVRAANGRVTLRHRRAEQCWLTEVPVAERAPVIREYLNQVPGARPHIPVDRHAEIEAFEAIAADYPVFQVSGSPEGPGRPTGGLRSRA